MVIQKDGELIHLLFTGLDRPQAPGAPSHWGGAPGPSVTSSFLEKLPLGSKVGSFKVLPVTATSSEDPKLWGIA